PDEPRILGSAFFERRMPLRAGRSRIKIRNAGGRRASAKGRKTHQRRRDNRLVQRTNGTRPAGTRRTQLFGRPATKGYARNTEPKSKTARMVPPAGAFDARRKRDGNFWRRTPRPFYDNRYRGRRRV